ncbi:hypothetical protein NB717_003866 [Xanthomonas sacchari]|nr:hypothetical protein [Xanthomonas sacchari]
MIAVGGGGVLGILGHHHDADAAVDRIVRHLLVEQHRGGQPDHARDLVLAHAAGDQFAARGVGAVRAQFPVAVAVLAAVLGDVGVAGDADVVGHLVDEAGQLVEDAAGVGLEHRAAEVEHRPVFLVHDLDAQAVRGQVQQQLVLERFQRLALVDGFLQLLHQRFQALLLLLALRGLAVVALQALAAERILVVAALHLAGAAELDHRGAGAAGAGHAGARRRALAGQRAGIAEVFGDRRALFLGGGRHQPQHQEERHHRGHEVGIGHLPRAAVVAAALDLLDPADDDGGFGLGHDRVT